MTERPGGAPFVNHLPQEVIDRFEATQHTAVKDADDGLKDWQPGERAHFEYHCLESPDSADADAWYHSHRPVTVVGPAEADGWADHWRGSTPVQRLEAGEPRAYKVRHDDGFEHTAFEDELLTDPSHWHRPNPPQKAM